MGDIEGNVKGGSAEKREERSASSSTCFRNVGGKGEENGEAAGTTPFDWTRYDCSRRKKIPKKTDIIEKIRV